LNLVSRIAGAARLLATGKLALSTGFDGAQMQRRLMAWRAGGESINSLMLQGGEEVDRRIAADHAREAELGLKFGRPATAREEPAVQVDVENRERPTQSEENAA
jgi:capsid protein